jgi:virulence-associated protein VapD
MSFFSFLIMFFLFPIEIFKLSHGFVLTNHMFNDIYKVTYQYLWKKTQGDIHIVYNLINIIIVKKLANVRCGFF